MNSFVQRFSNAQKMIKPFLHTENGKVDFDSTVENFVMELKFLLNEVEQVRTKILNDLIDYAGQAPSNKVIPKDSLCSFVAMGFSNNPNEYSEFNELVASILEENSSTDVNIEKPFFWVKKGRNAGVYLWANKP